MFNYGSKNELNSAVKSIVRQGVKETDITEDLINQSLYTHDLPDPDILIRPGGEHRLSNFMLGNVRIPNYFLQIHYGLTLR